MGGGRLSRGCDVRAPVAVLVFLLAGAGGGGGFGIVLGFGGLGERLPRSLRDVPGVVPMVVHRWRHGLGGGALQLIGVVGRHDLRRGAHERQQYRK